MNDRDIPSPTCPRSLTAEEIVLGAGALALVADWDAWVSRRVDSFCFAGDDERVLRRQQSMDFMFPRLASELGRVEASLGGIPVPVTFVDKWRLPEFSLLDDGRPLSLLARERSSGIAAGMLYVLANLRAEKSLTPKSTPPPYLRQWIWDVVTSDPSTAIRLCAQLGELGSSAAPGEGSKPDKWSAGLACDETFMGLAYELARGFVLFALYPPGTSGRQILKFSYSSYVVPARRDRFSVWFSHLGRRIARRSRDVTDSVAWSSRDDRDGASLGRISLSTICTRATVTGRAAEASAACALVRIMGPEGRTLTLRLRANAALSLEHVPVGWYLGIVEPQSGYAIQGSKLFSFRIDGDETRRVEIRASRQDVSARVMVAPLLLAKPASLTRTAMRGVGWFSKPLAVRLRLGDGGSYHCEFEAPPGLHVTRARLVSNAEFETEDKRTGEIDISLESAQRAHLYAPAPQTRPATAYAFVNLRPRSETVARPAVWTAIFVLAAIVFLAATWHTDSGFLNHGGPEDSSAIVVLLIGAPSALAAYFAQAVPSRVTNSMLYGLRLAALLPALLVLMAGAVMLIGERRHGAHWVLWGLAGGASLAIGALGATVRCTEHPPEQRESDLDQGEGYEQTYSLTDGEGDASPAPKSRPGAHETSVHEEAGMIRDQMLARSTGLSRGTRRLLLTQHGRWLKREFKVPPALYFDSAETPPSFLGFESRVEFKGVCSEVERLMLDLDTQMAAIDRTLGRAPSRLRVSGCD